MFVMVPLITLCLAAKVTPSCTLPIHAEEKGWEAALAAADAAFSYTVHVRELTAPEKVIRVPLAGSETILDAVAASGATTVKEALAAPAGSQTVAELIGDEAAILGEKVELRRVAVVKGEHFAIYLHKTSKDLPPQVGVVVGYTGADAETARSIAQHISFANPTYLSREDVPAEEVENERRIVEEISRNEGKPEAALPVLPVRDRAAFSVEALAARALPPATVRVSLGRAARVREAATFSRCSSECLRFPWRT